MATVDSTAPQSTPTKRPPTDQTLDILRTGRQTRWQQDPRQFKLTGEFPEGVVLHFLPGIGDAPAVVTYKRHTVLHVNRHVKTKYMQPCALDRGQRCPVCEANPELGRTTQQWAANVLIVDDGTQQNGLSGKVFILEFGAQIAETLELAVVDGLDPFDLSEKGPYFQLTASFNGAAANYRNSAFFFYDDRKPVPTPDRYLKKRHDLSLFPSLPEYDVLLEQFRKFTGCV
jgi:hypothetical protein